MFTWNYMFIFYGVAIPSLIYMLLHYENCKIQTWWTIFMCFVYPFINAYYTSNPNGSLIIHISF